MTLDELRATLDELAHHVPGTIPVDLGINTGGGGYRILQVTRAEVSTYSLIGGSKPESIRIYSQEIKADIHAVKPVPTGRVKKKC